MSLLAIPFPSIDPVALEIGPLAVRWYGLSYMAGLLLGWLYIRRLLREPALWPGGTAPFTPAKADDLLLYMTIGVVLGGRLGSVLLYEPAHYLRNPLEIFAVWKGGMAFHGALIGCALAIWLFSARNSVDTWSSMDLCAAATPIGLFFGRLANFINGELYGRPTDMPWGMVFPGVTRQYPEFLGIEPTPRHPSQLYEAFFEGIVLFLLLRWLTHSRRGLQTPGLVAGAFLLGYGCARSFCELFRQYDPTHVLSKFGLTPGIGYSVPMVLLGLWLIHMARTREAT